VTLDEEGKIPAGMVRIGGGSFGIRMTGMNVVDPANVDDYLIDEKEVTNREFKAFVDAGGYRDRKYWKHEFVKEGRKLPWDEAIGAFKDRAGRPGPATWELGAYPAGQDDFPVSGVSWYEAAAYAEFAGKSLPTIYQWSRAASPGLGASAVLPLSNIGGTALARAGSHPGWSLNGLYDAAGNVKEWCWNEAGRGRRYILGGAWNEPPYMFADPDAQEPFARLATYGFRCARALVVPPSDPSVFREIEWRIRDFSIEKPVPDPVFKAYRALYAYDKTDLDARVDATDDSAEAWRLETVSFNAAYGGERMSAQLYLPRGVAPPHKVVVLFPGSGALYMRSLNEAGDLVYLDFIIRSGRAVLYPVYKSTFERRDTLTTDTPAATSLYRDHVLQWSKDLGRSIDYLQSRPDLDAKAVAYYGFSWGAAMGAILPAVEDRIAASILVGGGLELSRTLPEVDAVNFAPRVRVPTLMINGRYDFFYGEESSQRPLFRLLGPKEPAKRHILRDSGHIVPRDMMIKDVLDWLDRYLGRVETR
jgi:dienelactone hydrolase